MKNDPQTDQKVTPKNDQKTERFGSVFIDKTVSLAVDPLLRIPYSVQLVKDQNFGQFGGRLLI